MLRVQSDPQCHVTPTAGWSDWLHAFCCLMVAAAAAAAVVSGIILSQHTVVLVNWL